MNKMTILAPGLILVVFSLYVQAFDPICLLPALSGNCHSGDSHSADSRYYYNVFNQKCEVFPYSGCGGNSNNFKMLDECVNKCGSPVIGHMVG